MAIVTVRSFPVRAVKPGCILRSHDMTIDAGFRFIGEIGRGPGDVESVATQTKKDSQQDDYREDPTGRRGQFTEYTHRLYYLVIKQYFQRQNRTIGLC